MMEMCKLSSLLRSFLTSAVTGWMSKAPTKMDQALVVPVELITV